MTSEHDVISPLVTSVACEMIVSVADRLRQHSPATAQWKHEPLQKLPAPVCGVPTRTVRVQTWLFTETLPIVRNTKALTSGSEWRHSFPLTFSFFSSKWRPSDADTMEYCQKCSFLKRPCFQEDVELSPQVFVCPGCNLSLCVVCVQYKRFSFYCLINSVVLHHTVFTIVSLFGNSDLNTDLECVTTMLFSPNVNPQWFFSYMSTGFPVGIWFISSDAAHRKHMEMSSTVCWSNRPSQVKSVWSSLFFTVASWLCSLEGSGGDTEVTVRYSPAVFWSRPLYSGLLQTMTDSSLSHSFTTGNLFII